ncbi:flagellin lysine-N-methylase [Pseudocitrobacter cyperus]|uniref:Flagellin lysine-N-methylase n=1 Tax=Pseudocitrobacter cyperus TaxID=3112843 RepID=A0ABV0HPI5_9ENTR
MKIHKTVKPVFVSKFQCVGPDCLMSCCRGWSIFIDKKTHHKYLTADNKEIATIAKENLILLRKGKNQYSRIKLDQHGDCPFMAENKLCTVHREMGESALSRTCSIYPRLEQKYEDETRHCMTLSCPEVVRLALFDPEGMMLHEQEELLAHHKTNLIGKRQSAGQVQQVIHLFSWHLLQSDSLNVEENLMALAQFILCLQKYNFDLHNHFTQVEDFYHALLNELHSGRTLIDKRHSASATKLKLQALAVMGTHVASDSQRDNFTLEGHRLISDWFDITNQNDLNLQGEKFAAINLQWEKVCATSCLAEPHVLRNYLLYKIYNGYFPGKDTATILRQFYRIVLDFYYIKVFLSVKSMHQEVDQTMVMKTIASFSQRTMHNTAIDARLNHIINKINGGDDLSALLLIG